MGASGSEFPFIYHVHGRDEHQPGNHFRDNTQLYRVGTAGVNSILGQPAFPFQECTAFQSMVDDRHSGNCPDRYIGLYHADRGISQTAEQPAAQ